MITVERTVTTNADLEQVAAYLSDFSTTEQWDPNTASCRQIDAGPVRVGARFANTQKVGPARTTLEYRVTGYTPNSFVELECDSRLLRSVDRMQFSHGPGGTTTVTYRASINLKGIGGLAEPGFKIVMNRIADKAAASMGRHLDELVS